MAVQENSKFLEIIDVKEIGEGMRVCIDFVDILEKSDGLFVGNTGHGYVKVISENRHSEGYPPRPFRINCGSFHQYLFQNGKTMYLHEIMPGEQLSVYGELAEKSIAVGRVKIEKRPLLRVECRSEEGIISATLQKSSSVHLIEENKGEVSILDIKPTDRILCIQDKPGRHLGEEIDEIIVEL